MSVSFHAINEALVLIGVEELVQVVHFDGDQISLLVHHGLQHGHVLQVAVDRIKLVLWNRGIAERRDEVRASLRLALVIRHVNISVNLQFHFSRCVVWCRCVCKLSSF